MKVFIKTVLVALLVCTLASVSVSAGAKGKVKKETLTVPEDIMVNGTLVKAGQYDFRFDEEAGELTVLRDGKIKAKAPAQLQSRTEKAKMTALRTIKKGDTAKLLGITYGGWNQDVVVNGAQ